MRIIAETMNLKVRDKNGQPVNVNAQVFPVLHVTDKRPSGVAVLGKSAWFSVEEARSFARQQSTMNPDPQRFIVFDENERVDSIWKAGKKVALFSVEASDKSIAREISRVASLVAGDTSNSRQTISWHVLKSFSAVTTAIQDLRFDLRQLEDDYIDEDNAKKRELTTKILDFLEKISKKILDAHSTVLNKLYKE